MSIIGWLALVMKTWFGVGIALALVSWTILGYRAEQKETKEVYGADVADILALSMLWPFAIVGFLIWALVEAKPWKYLVKFNPVELGRFIARRTK